MAKELRDNQYLFNGLSCVHSGVASISGSAFNIFGGFSITNFTALHRYAGGTQNIANLERLVLTLIYELHKRDTQTNSNSALP